MKQTITQEIREIFRESKTWVELQIEFTKLTAAEKFTLLTSTFVVGAICMMLGMVVVFLLSFSLVDLFKMMMAPALAYLTVSGILILLIALIYLFRRVIIFNPIAKYITRLLLSPGQTQNATKDLTHKD
ncbi:MAG: phage holin family protein [Bacteroides sp.]|nr:phage holin family protein [Bacteroides sp.]